MARSNYVIIYPCKRLFGTLSVPGDKSISHRVAILSALASQTSKISGFLQSEDCINTVKAVASLGAGIANSGGFLSITGTGGDFQRPQHPLDFGNSGTGMRLLAGILAAQPFTTELTGDASLRSRPMKRIKEPLEKMGARVELLGHGDCAPVRIRGNQLHGIDYTMPVASAQVKSCILLAALFSEGKTRIHELIPTRDHTERLLKRMGVPLQIEPGKITVNGYGKNGPQLPAQDWCIPGDFSSAAFWLVAASACPKASVTIKNVGLNPTRTGLLNVLKRMGVTIQVSIDPGSEESEPLGAVSVMGDQLSGTEIGNSEIPILIDELPLIAVAGALADGITVIKDASELRVKESDRIGTLSANLRLMGVSFQEKEDGLVIRGGSPIQGSKKLESYCDHRIAMATAILALFADKPSIINNVTCVNTSYPEFWRHLRSLGAHVDFNHSN